MQPDYSDIDVGVWVPLQQPELKLPIKLPINVVKQERRRAILNAPSPLSSPSLSSSRIFLLE